MWSTYGLTVLIYIMPWSLLDHVFEASPTAARSDFEVSPEKWNLLDNLHIWAPMAHNMFVLMAWGQELFKMDLYKLT